jgi:DUF4097 and DUF4098 domain-containing protein YvlB
VRPTPQYSNRCQRIAVWLWLRAILLFGAAAAHSQTSKHLEQRFAVTELQSVAISGLHGGNVTIRSWDKPEIAMNLTFTVKAASASEERAFLDSVRIEERGTEQKLTLTVLEHRDFTEGTNILGLTLPLRVLQEKRIVGEILVPNANALTVLTRHATLGVHNLQSDVRLHGNHNILNVSNCAALRSIKNDNGIILITSCGGNVDMEAVRAAVVVERFRGVLEAEVPYTSVTIATVQGDVRCTSRNTTLTVSDVQGNVLVSSPFSTISVRDVSGYVGVTSKTGKIFVNNAAETSVRAEYSVLDVANIVCKKHSITLATKAGSVRLTNARGNVSIEAASSPVTLLNVRGNVELQGSGARIDVRALHGDWASTTRNAQYVFREVTSAVMSITNRGGEVDVALKTLPVMLFVGNDQGAITASMPEGFAGTVEAEAEYGSVITNLRLSHTNAQSTAKVNGIVGSPAKDAKDKETPAIILKTKGAAITLLEQAQ